MKKLFSLHLMILTVLSVSILTSCDKEDVTPMDDMKEMMNPDDDGKGDDSDDGNQDPGDDNDPGDGNNSGGNDWTGNAPNFSLESVSGGTVTLSDFGGKPILLFFFGNSCPNCLGVAPKIETLHQQYQMGEITVLGIDTWNGNQSSVQSFKNNTGVTFDLLLNGSGVQTDYSTSYDRLILINAEGNIIHSTDNSANRDLATVEDLIKGLL